MVKENQPLQLYHEMFADTVSNKAVQGQDSKERWNKTEGKPGNGGSAVLGTYFCILDILHDNKMLGWVVVAHAFSPRIQEAEAETEAGGFWVWLKLVWSKARVPEQPELYSLVLKSLCLEMP